MQWWEQRNKKDAEKKLFERNLAEMQRRFGINSYATNMAARETAKSTNPQGLAIYDEMMRERRAKQIEDDTKLTDLKLARERLRAQRMANSRLYDE